MLDSGQIKLFDNRKTIGNGNDTYLEVHEGENGMLRTWRGGKVGRKRKGTKDGSGRDDEEGWGWARPFI